MRITGQGIWGEPKDRNEAKRVLQRLMELGVNFIDTADAYGPEVSENLIAEALHPYPKGLVIATKGGLTRQGPNAWAPVARPEYLRQCVEMSLRRLKLDRIDLYQLHRFDEKVPVEESLGELKKLQSEGKIRHIGISEVSVKDIEGPKNCESRERPKQIQHWRSHPRGRSDVLRQAPAWFHSMVSHGSRQTQPTRQQA
jgi:pyridoxine 4-dehydrogenase